MITELLFYLLRVGSKPTAASFDPTTTFTLMDGSEKLACGIAIALYTAHNLFLIYGNWLFLSLPRTNSAGVSWLELEPGIDDSAEVANKWLFISLKMIFIFSLLHLAIFTSILISMAIYAYLVKTIPEEQMEAYKNIHPFRLWLIADDGVFAVADTLDRDDDNFESSRAYEDRIINNAMSEIEKQLALERLKEKNFGQMRKET